MLPTPSTLHVPFDRVYEPAEDSYLLLDTLSSNSEKAFLQTHFALKTDNNKQDTNLSQASSVSPPDPLLVAEIGTGSGVVIAFVTANADVIFGRTDISTIGVDINVHACKATEETVRIAIEEQKSKSVPCGKYLGNFVGDLAAPLTPGTVDVLIFNPPYVPTATLPTSPDTQISSDGNGDHGMEATFEEDSHFLELSYAGGIDGMETTDRLLEGLPTVLRSTRGMAYILLCAQNKPEAVKERIRAWGWMVETVGSSGKKAGWEKLQIIRIWRKTIP